MIENNKPEYIFEFRYHNLHLNKYNKIIKRINISSKIIYCSAISYIIFCIISLLIKSDILWIVGISCIAIELIALIYFIILIFKKRKYEKTSRS